MSTSYDHVGASPIERCREGTTLHRWFPTAAAVTILLMSGCGDVQQTATSHKALQPPVTTHAAHETAARPVTVGTAAHAEKSLSYDGFWLRVPTAWTLGRQVRIYKAATTGSYASELLPKMLPDRGPGITSDPGNQSPFFSEQLQVAADTAYLQLGELGADGDCYSLQIAVPSREIGALRAATASLRHPPIATATDDVRFILRDARDGALSPRTAALGTEGAMARRQRQSG